MPWISGHHFNDLIKINQQLIKECRKSSVNFGFWQNWVQLLLTLVDSSTLVDSVPDVVVLDLDWLLQVPHQAGQGDKDQESVWQSSASPAPHPARQSLAPLHQVRHHAQHTRDCHQSVQEISSGETIMNIIWYPAAFNNIQSISREKSVENI